MSDEQSPRPTRYVVGFLYAEGSRGVVLIRKNRPDWQAGLLNGVGGKVEPSEGPRAAMVREFFEETGVATVAADWYQFCELMDSEHEGVVTFFGLLDRTHDLYDAVVSRTDERIEKWAIDPTVPAGTVPNLRWLLPMGWYHLTERRLHADVYEAGKVECPAL